MDEAVPAFTIQSKSNMDDQISIEGLELESLDSDQDVTIQQEKISNTAKPTKRSGGARVMITEPEYDVFKKHDVKLAERPNLSTPKRLAYQKSVKTINHTTHNLTSGFSHHDGKRNSKQANNSKFEGSTTRSRFGKVAVTRPSKQGF